MGLWVLHDDEIASAPVTRRASPSRNAVHVSMTPSAHTYPHDDCTCVSHWNDPGPRMSFDTSVVSHILTQILACHGQEAFFVALESALHQRRLTAQARQILRSAIAVSHRWLVDFARNDAESGLESLVRLRLRRFGLLVRTQQSIVAVGRVDLLIGDRLIIEVDGRVNHEGASLRHKDLVRDANAAAWGLTTLRFDYSLVIHDWDLVERAILAHATAA